MVYFVTENCVCITDGKSAIIRSKALKECYSIPGYKDLPLEYKNIIYDFVKARIEDNMEV